MTDVVQQVALRWSTKRKRKSCCFLAVFNLALSLIFLVLSFVFLQRSSSSSTSNENTRQIATKCGGVGAILFVFGGLTVIILHCTQRQDDDPSSSPPQVIVSEIPAEDLEKSPAPILPYNRIPHQAFVETSSLDLADQSITDTEIVASSGDSPDYFTTVGNDDQVELEASLAELPNYSAVVQNVDEAYLSLDLSSRLDDTPSTPPPSYEEALTLTPPTIIA